MSLDYSSHLQLSQLLNLQKTITNDKTNDELFFILIHQVHELLFKMLISELDAINILFLNNDIDNATNKWKRCCLIIKTSLSQFNTLETMTPTAFNEFRYALGEASGAQSYQFREIEFLLGYKRQHLIQAFHQNEIATNILAHRLNSPSIIDVFYHFLKMHGAIIDCELLNKEICLSNVPNENLQSWMDKIVPSHSKLTLLFKWIYEFDKIFLDWRNTHWETVRRMIGVKMGTGGTKESDRAYVSNEVIFFPDLWTIRNKL